MRLAIPGLVLPSDSPSRRSLGAVFRYPTRIVAKVLRTGKALWRRGVRFVRGSVVREHLVEISRRVVVLGDENEQLRKQVFQIELQNNAMATHLSLQSDRILALLRTFERQSLIETDRLRTEQLELHVALRTLVEESRRESGQDER